MPTELNVYVPFFSVTVQVARPTPLTLVCLCTPGPLSWKFRVFDVSVTTNVYSPLGRQVRHARRRRAAAR